MIKKLLASFVLFSSVGISSSFAQCTPDVSCIPVSSTYGICPDSTTGLASGTVGVPYNQVVSMKVPADPSGFGAPPGTGLTSIDIVGVDSLAPGLSYTCVPASCSFPAATNGCILISGTPSVVWNHQIIVHAMGHLTLPILGTPFTQGIDNKQYRSIVLAPAGIETLDLTKFDVDQNSPNPFSENTEIRFSSITNSQVEFKVYNLLGAVIFDNRYAASKGVNSIRIEANSFSPGVYIYSITNGDKTITKRMIVAMK
ncbi:MAG: T9SS type A sorting domain-containing protein [Bacteroidetes bacterium]|nr:T9SS type A sorting domain-containing protein [Bacteroidota bacterium]